MQIRFFACCLYRFMYLQEVEKVASQIDIFQSVLCNQVVSQFRLNGELSIAGTPITCNSDAKYVCLRAKESSLMRPGSTLRLHAWIVGYPDL